MQTSFNRVRNSLASSLGRCNISTVAGTMIRLAANHLRRIGQGIGKGTADGAEAAPSICLYDAASIILKSNNRGNTWYPSTPWKPPQLRCCRRIDAGVRISQ